MTNTCTICLDTDLKLIKYIFPCKCSIFFHESCLNEWYKKNITHHICPICRITIKDTDNISFNIIIPFNQYIINTNEQITNNPIYRLTDNSINNSNFRNSPILPISTIMPPYSYIWNHRFQNITIRHRLLYYLYKFLIVILISGCAVLPFIIFYIAVKYNW
jgi:hypothetical protein